MSHANKIYTKEKYMQKVLIGILVFVVILVTGCGALFPTNYDRVDAERVRVLDFRYEPAEAGPGDLVKMYALFAGAGDSLIPQDIDWTVSFNVLSNDFGVDTALDIQPLMMQSYSFGYFSPNTSCLILSFRIPDSVMYNSASIPENWSSIIPAEYQSDIPDFIKSLSKNELIAFTQDLSKSAKKWGQVLKNNPGAEDSLLQADTLYPLYKNYFSQYIPAMLQFLTIKIRLFAEIQGAQKVRSTYAVRYNNCYKDIPGSRVYVNSNPVIDSVGIYKVNKANLQSFDPAVSNYTYEFIRLFSEDELAAFPDSIQTVEIDGKCTYFVAGFAAAPDSSLTIQSALQDGPATVEVLSTKWYFQLDEKEIAGVSPYDFMNIMNVGGFIEILYPPVDKRVKTFTLWLEVNDFLLNEINRPQGSNVREVRGRFKYL